MTPKPRPELAIGAAPSMSTPRARRVRDHGTAHAPSRTESTTEPGVAARPMLAPAGWSLYGAPWLQLVAINGKSDGRGSAENKPKPLRSVATGCREKYPLSCTGSSDFLHGKEGVPVRVREETSIRAPENGASRLSAVNHRCEAAASASFAPASDALS